MLYFEEYRIDAYFSIRDINRLKQLRADYEFWSIAAPMEYREAWSETLVYCKSKLLELGQK